MEPKKPYRLRDAPAPAPQYPGDDPVVREQHERAMCQRMALSGPLGHGPYALEYGASIGAQSPEAAARELERQMEVRACAGGLPDSSPEAPPKYRDAPAEKPYKL